MQLKAFIASGLVALDDQLADFIGKWNGNGLLESFVIQATMAMHIFENHGAKTGIGKWIKIQFSPGTVIMSGAYASTIGALKALQIMERADHLLAKRRAERAIKNLNVATERIGFGGGVQGKLRLSRFISN